MMTYRPPGRAGAFAAALLSLYSAVWAAVSLVVVGPDAEGGEQGGPEFGRRDLVRGEQRRHPQQRVTGLGDEALKITRLLPVHVVLSVLSPSPHRRHPPRL